MKEMKQNEKNIEGFSIYFTKNFFPNKCSFQNCHSITWNSQLTRIVIVLRSVFIARISDVVFIILIACFYFKTGSQYSCDHKYIIFKDSAFVMFSVALNLLAIFRYVINFRFRFRVHFHLYFHFHFDIHCFAV